MGSSSVFWSIVTPRSDDETEADDARRLGKAPGLARVDLDDRHLRCRERYLQLAVVGPGWFVNHAMRESPDPSDQGLVPSFACPAAKVIRQAVSGQADTGWRQENATKQ